MGGGGAILFSAVGGRGRRGEVVAGSRHWVRAEGMVGGGRWPAGGHGGERDAARITAIILHSAQGVRDALDLLEGVGGHCDCLMFGCLLCSHV